MKVLCVSWTPEQWIWGCDIFPEWMRLVFGVKSSLCCWWGPSRGDFWLWRAVICGLIIARLNFPPLLGLRKHTHSHTCMYTHFLCYTFSIFLLSPSQHMLPSPSSSMRFPDVFPVFADSGLSQVPCRFKLLKVVELPLSEPCDPPTNPSLPLTCPMFEVRGGCKGQGFTML